jgi:hypothetical protein
MCVNNFVDSYYIKWRLRDDDGKEWEETYVNMSTADYEELYGKNVHMIVWCEMRLMKEVDFYGEEGCS